MTKTKSPPLAIAIILIAVAIAFFSLSFISSHGEETFAKAELIINEKISCDVITDNQLEMLGDFYCGEHDSMSEDMMNLMMGRSSMMGGNMGNMMGTSYGYGFMGFFAWIFWILIIIALVLLIVWLVTEIRGKSKKK